MAPTPSTTLRTARRTPTGRPSATGPAAPRRPAGFQGEGLLALDPGDGSPVRLWAAPDPAASVPSIRLAVHDGRAEIGADGPVTESSYSGPDGVQGALAAWADALATPAPR